MKQSLGIFEKVHSEPLNTHPSKDLTDEEIRVVWYGRPEFKDGLGVDPIPFARAILRKAQEK